MVSVFLVLTLAGFVQAAEHVHSHTMTPEMHRQHMAMDLTQKEWTACRKSLSAGDFAAAGASLLLLQKAAGELEEFQPHRNAQRMEDFRKQAQSFILNLSDLGKAIGERDKARTQSLSRTIEKGCTQCHGAFR